ncbi:hypothetical protein BGZ63DRAFT_427580 [Mariannaea sp. PMI_226]|nr:hypothetical protein BGZ63DRAFT_427580 [Mariannaea sp. PMI_226]
MSTTPPPPDPNAPLFGASRTIDRHGLLAVIWICFSVASLFVAVRLTVRWRQNQKFLSDDYWVIWAWMCSLTMGILQTQQMDSLWYITYLVAGRVAFDPQEYAFQHYQLTRWQFPIIKMFWITLWSVKASFMAAIYRLVQPFPVLRRLWYAVAVFAALALVACILTSALTCKKPSDYFYGACDTPHEVLMQRVCVIYSTSVDIASDIMIMALPISVLPSLQLDKKKKIGLGIAFCLGVIIICVASVRMSQVIVNQTVDLVGLAIWGAVETATALIVGSLPPLKSLISRGVKKYQTSRKATEYGGSSSATSRQKYGPGTATRTIMVAESIPLDDMHRSGQMDGRIYVHKTFDTQVERDDSSSRDDDDEAAIVKDRRYMPGDHKV